ncbi:MAG: efflux RND transporter periplasmic adaptor subunit [Proteobacteria bacterium]|nr:efflux RND transporter periplasmic adaptor subunit [Pseudomonadota bacterium]
MKKNIVISLIFLILLFGCSKKEANTKEGVTNTINVELYSVQKVKVSDLYEVSGNLVSKNPVNIVSKVMGTIVSINVNEGDRVSKDKLLIQIDSPEISAMLDRAQASIEEAKKSLIMAKTNEKLAESTFKRYENLYKEQAISKQEFEVKETAYLVAKSEVERLENVIRQAEAEKARVKGMQSYLYVYAPVSGIVTKKFVTPGTNILPGMQLITIEPEDNLRVEVNADEKVLGMIKIGKKIPVYVEALNKEFEGVVAEIIPAIDTQSRTFKMKIDLPKNRDLAIGLYATVRIAMGTKDAIYIPKSALYSKGQLDYVYVVGNDKKLSLRLLRIGKISNNMVEVLSGLNEGEKIVKVVEDTVREGVEIQ